MFRHNFPLFIPSKKAKMGVINHHSGKIISYPTDKQRIIGQTMRMLKYK
jgi:hypothetical protein